MGEARTLSQEPATRVLGTEDKLDQELASFERMRSGLLRTHRGLFVAIHHGAVQDSDSDEWALAARIEDLARREGAIAICHVCEKVDPEVEEEFYADFESPSVEEAGA